MKRYHHLVSLNIHLNVNMLPLGIDYPNKTCTCSASSSNDSRRELIPTKTVKDVIIPEHFQSLRSHLESDLIKVIGSLVPVHMELTKIIDHCLQQSISKAMDGMQERSLLWTSHLYRNNLSQQHEHTPFRKKENQNPPNAIIQTSTYSQMTESQNVTSRRDICFASLIFGVDQGDQTDPVDQNTVQPVDEDEDPVKGIKTLQDSANEEENLMFLRYFMDQTPSVE